MNGHGLRDLRRNTEMLLLVELVESPTARSKDLAKKLSVTVQAVSQYLSAMRKEGLIRKSPTGHHATRQGMQLLQEHFTSLKADIDATLRRISVIDRCVAIAGKDVSKGDKVGLVMEDGMLMAFPAQKATSSGRALEDAEEGDDVLIGQLEGIVEMELGKLLLVEVPSELEGGSKSADVERARDRIDSFSPGLLVAGDTIGAAFLMKTSGELFTIHAPVPSAMSALSKGVDVVYCGTHESTDQLLREIGDLKRESGYEIKWRAFKA